MSKLIANLYELVEEVVRQMKQKGYSIHDMTDSGILHTIRFNTEINIYNNKIYVNVKPKKSDNIDFLIFRTVK